MADIGLESRILSVRVTMQFVTIFSKTYKNRFYCMVLDYSPTRPHVIRYEL